MITATAQGLQRQQQQNRRLGLWGHALATMMALLTAAPGSNAFLGAIATQARLSSTMTPSPSLFAGQSAQAIAPRARTLVRSSVAHENISMTWGTGRRLSELRMSAEAAVDVEQIGIVTVYFKDTCPHCKEALTLLEGDYKLNVTKVDVLEGDDSSKKIKQMKTFSGRDTVPQIFFNSQHIGGNDDLQKLHQDGKLPDMVAKIRAEPAGMMKDSWYHPWY